MAPLHPISRFILLALLSFQSIMMAANAGWSGSIGAEFQGYRHSADLSQQHQFYSALIIKPEYIDEWNNGKHLLQFSALARINNNNSNQNHAAIREMYWSYASDHWELNVGIRKVFWGVTESQHLVDIINQTDIADGFDGESKIGQAMINFASIHDWGTLDFFILPGFNLRRFPSTDARLRPPFTISNDNATYDSSLKKKHVDLALRYSHYLGNWDFGFSHFYGTNREPRLKALTPHYDLIQQTGVEVQATLENWLWKFEGIHRSGMEKRYFASTLGIEYTFFTIFNTGADIGLVTEHLYDTRSDEATTAFENDAMLAIRIALNDEQSSEALIGVITDIEGDGNILSFDASRRLGDSFKLTVSGYWFWGATQPTEPLHFFRKDDHISIEFSHFF